MNASDFDRQDTIRWATENASVEGGLQIVRLALAVLMAGLVVAVFVFQQ